MLNGEVTDASKGMGKVVVSFCVKNGKKLRFNDIKLNHNTYTPMKNPKSEFMEEVMTRGNQISAFGYLSKKNNNQGGILPVLTLWMSGGLIMAAK